jgi:hypothetical protein
MAALYITLRNGDVLQVVPHAGGDMTNEARHLMGRQGNPYSDGWVEVAPVTDFGADRDTKYVPISEITHIRVAD